MGIFYFIVWFLGTESARIFEEDRRTHNYPYLAINDSLFGTITSARNMNGTDFL